MIEMANMLYPLPDFEQDLPQGLPPVMPTKDHYARVTEDSPIFVMDCEMCVTGDRPEERSELTRVTLVSYKFDE
jgi:hypothetical protein